MSEKKKLWEVARDSVQNGESENWWKTATDAVIAEHERRKKEDDDFSAYLVDQPADPYAELKAAAQDPTKQIRIIGMDWMDYGHPWTFRSYTTDSYEIRDKPKPKPMKNVKLLGWLDMFGELRLFEDVVVINSTWKRVPGEDREIEVME